MKQKTLWKKKNGWNFVLECLPCHPYIFFRFPYNILFLLFSFQFFFSFWDAIVFQTILFFYVVKVCVFCLCLLLTQTQMQLQEQKYKKKKRYSFASVIPNQKERFFSRVNNLSISNLIRHVVQIVTSHMTASY